MRGGRGRGRGRDGRKARNVRTIAALVPALMRWRGYTRGGRSWINRAGGWTLQERKLVTGDTRAGHTAGACGGVAPLITSLITPEAEPISANPGLGTHPGRFYGSLAAPG